MPTSIPGTRDTYVKLHELSETQLNIGEVQISGLCSTCTAMSKLFIQEVGQHDSTIKTNKAKELGQEIKAVSLAIDKHLVQQLPVIKQQMQEALAILLAQESSLSTNPTSNLAHPYMKTIRVLQDNIVQIDRQLGTTMQRVLKTIPETRKNEFEQLLGALSIYQSTLCGVTVISTELGRLNIFLSSLKSIVDLYGQAVSNESEKEQLQEYTPVIEKLADQSHTLLEWFRTRTVNNLSIMKVYESAKHKHVNLSKQLTGGDFSNSGLLLAVAQRHETTDLMRHGLQSLRSIQEVYETLSKNVMTSFETIQAKDINALAEELIQSEPAPVRVEQAIIKKSPKALKTIKAPPVQTEMTSRPIEKPIAIQFNVELSKLADWLSDDISTLKISRSDGKRQLGQIMAEQLQEVYGQIEVERWPTDNVEVQQYKADMEKRLSTLEQLIADAMAHPSPSPSITPQSSSLSSSSGSGVITAATAKSKPVNPIADLPTTVTTALKPSSSANSPLSTSEAVKPPATAIKPVARLTPFDAQLQQSVKKLNTVRTKIFDAYSKQENFRQQLLLSNQPHSMAWVNINQTAMVVDFLSQNIAFQPHLAYVKPYEDHCLPMAEMIRSIQAERNHPHFDQRNCQAYLGHASRWLDSFKPQFDYLDQLLSVTESMVTDKPRVA